MFSRFKEFFKFRSSSGDNDKSEDISSGDGPIDDMNLNSNSSPSKNVSTAAEAEEEVTVVYPTGKNEMASSAITHKLTEIAEVAEALDSALRDTQNGLDLVEMNSSPSEKKMEHSHHHHHLNGSNIEDWYSRSTEDESFATASEGNFTPHSHSSSFQTASEGPSFLSSGKTSFDSSDLEENASQIFPLDMLSPGNISFDGSSEPSFISAQQSLTASPQSVPPDSGIDSTSEFKSIGLRKNNQQQHDNDDDDEDEDNHSRSATPTPGRFPTSKLTSSDNTTIIDNNVVAGTTSLNDDLHEVAATASNVNDGDEVSASVCSTKPTDSSWRSKYYGHVTKQTIKGCL